jgi:hypothetical protein
MGELFYLLVPKTVKAVAAIVVGFGGSILLAVWLLDVLLKAGIL